MRTMTGRLLTALAGALLLGSAGPAGEEPVSAEPAWVGPMREVHGRFKGKAGTFAQFGDSITFSMAFWAPLQWKAGKAGPEFEPARELVAGHMHADCWRSWKGPRWGNESGQTAAWALENVDRWLREIDPEVALVMFGTNDLRSVSTADYTARTRELVKRCLANGTVVILSTIPPRSGYADKAAEYARAARGLAAELKLPLVDFHAEILRRRPDDWDGSAGQFQEYSTYEVPTLVARDGVHPSNPKDWQRDYTEEGLRRNGFELRNYLTLLAYAEVIGQVLKPGSGKGGKPADDGAGPGAAPSGAAPAGASSPASQPSEAWWPKAPALPAPPADAVRVSSARELHEALRGAKPGATIVVAAGRYRIERRLEIRADRVTLRGATGNRADVVLDGGGIGELLAFTACRGVTVADLSIENVRWNGFKLNSETGVQELTLRNCTIHNVWQRGVKGVIVPVEKREQLRPAGCRVEYCLFYNDRAKRFEDDPDDKPGANFDGNYIGGIDVMHAKGWTISDNVFLGIQGRTREARGAVFLWHEVEDCVVERNVIVDCDAGVCLGNSFLPRERGIELHARRCIVRNNFVTRAPESCLLAAHTEKCLIVNNTVSDPENRLRRLVRLVGTNQGLLVANNLLSGPPVDRTSPSKVTFADNLEKVLTEAFVDPARGNLRLRQSRPDVVDRARPLAEVTEDIDRRRRGEKPDIGAQEFAPPAGE